MSNEENVMKAWDNSAEAWVNFVRTGKDYTRDGLNNPATFKVIGDVKGLVVLDLACGEGYNTRILARMGAKPTSVDFSEKMIEYARKEEARERLMIRYIVLDAANLQGLVDNHFDLVTCFMALQDIENYRQATSEVSRVLRPGGRFVFSIPHPCFERITVGKERIEAANRYFEEAKYEIQWNMERLSMPFRSFSFHRTLTDYFASLYRSGLWATHLLEPQLAEEAFQKYPYLQDALVKPQSLIVESVKTPARVWLGRGR